MSADVFLGVPFNIASYALLTHMIAQVTGYTVGDLIITFGNLHLYTNHIEQAKKQLDRRPNPLPTLTLTPHTDIDDFQFKDFTFNNYNHADAIPAPIAV